MNVHYRDLLLSGAVLSVATAAFSYQTQGYINAPWVLGSIIGPLLNAHLIARYFDLKIVKENRLLAMLVTGLVSVFVFNWVIVFLAVVGAIALGKIMHGKNSQTKKKT